MKIVRVFEAKANANGIKLNLRGSSYNQSKVLSSFIVIPVVLIDNAIKHSERNSQVIITVRDDGTSVTVEVSSYGALVPKTERTAIFVNKECAEATIRAVEADSVYTSQCISQLRMAAA